MESLPRRRRVNLIPFKSSTEPLDKDDCIVEGRRMVELSEIVRQLQA